MTTLVDSNVILDIFTEDSEWLDWSAAMLARLAETGRKPASASLEEMEALWQEAKTRV